MSDFQTAPGYDGVPVILTHIVMDNDSNVAYCAPVKVLSPLETDRFRYRTILCPACAIAIKQKADKNA